MNCSSERGGDEMEVNYRGYLVRHSDVLRAMVSFDQPHATAANRSVRQNFPNWRRWAVRHNGQLYPPKEILRWATNCPDRHDVTGGGPDVNPYYEHLGFEIVDLHAQPN